MVTAEVAVGLIGLTSLAIGLVWLLVLGVAQIQAIDAAREGARAAARGESAATINRVVALTAPGDAQVSVTSGTRAGLEVVVVNVTARVDAPFPGVPTVTVTADATALKEPQ